jgi:diacylglycerol kinase (ATP)
MPQKPRIILNPVAGKGHAAKCLPQIQSLLQEYNFDYDLYLTEGPGHALELSRQAVKDGCSMVIAAGGDGTVNEVINGLMQARVNGNELPALGVLPDPGRRISL